uniref:BZIP domain-containing protein n=1 Tax=Eptatretus burgeri TaxID=7764 RepID=A0A8C4N6Y4_EPTBU
MSMLGILCLTPSLYSSQVRDIRRRGRNKAAAHKCRRRRLQGVAQLHKDLLTLREMREYLQAEALHLHQAVLSSTHQLEELRMQVITLGSNQSQLISLINPMVDPPLDDPDGSGQTSTRPPIRNPIHLKETSKMVATSPSLAKKKYLKTKGQNK